jgi:double-stranded uracil-DNA glycosylase
MKPSIVTHTFDPVFDLESRILILGTMPSVRSRAEGFYYMHPLNRFWKVVSEVFGQPFPDSRGSKMLLLQEHGIALWDVLKSCCINGSSDSSIKGAVPNDIAGLISKSRIKSVFTNGHTASVLYRKLCLEDTGIEDNCLPSTSPANNRYHKYVDLVKEWSVIKVE